MNAEVNSCNRNAALASNYATRIRGRHKGLKCDLKGIKINIVRIEFGWPKNSKYKSYLTRKT